MYLHNASNFIYNILSMIKSVLISRICTFHVMHIMLISQFPYQVEVMMYLITYVFAIGFTMTLSTTYIVHIVLKS